MAGRMANQIADHRRNCPDIRPGELTAQQALRICGHFYQFLEAHFINIDEFRDRRRTEMPQTSRQSDGYFQALEAQRSNWQFREIGYEDSTRFSVVSEHFDLEYSLV